MAKRVLTENGLLMTGDLLKCLDDLFFLNLTYGSQINEELILFDAAEDGGFSATKGLLQLCRALPAMANCHK